MLDAIASPVSLLSPVIIITRMPAFLQFTMEDATCSQKSGHAIGCACHEHHRSLKRKRSGGYLGARGILKANQAHKRQV